MSDLRIKRYDFEDPRLQRHVVHDPRSLDFPTPLEKIDPKTWRTRNLRIYDPRPNPNQTIGNCTAVSKCVQFNTVDNRVKGKVLNMDDAVWLYTYETQIDPFSGTYPPDDTGSNGLAACKAAKYFNLGTSYTWLFSPEAIVQAVMEGWAVSVGTRWDEQMFNTDSQGLVHPGGSVAGGHQWTVKGWDATLKAVIGVCWWGDFRLFKMKFEEFSELMADDGDAHIQHRAV